MPERRRAVYSYRTVMEWLTHAVTAAAGRCVSSPATDSSARPMRDHVDVGEGRVALALRPIVGQWSTVDISAMPGA